MAEYPVTNRKEPIKPLKIRPSAMEPIDIVLRGSVVTGFVSLACAWVFRFCRSFQDDISNQIAPWFSSGLIFKGLRRRIMSEWLVVIEE